MFITLAKWVKSSNSTQAITTTKIREKQKISLDAFDIFKMSSIDPSIGLSITQNNTALYHKLLVKFLAQNKNFEQQFQHADISSDPEIKCRMAHTLKSTAGNIGAQTLYAACQTLETECEQADNEQLIANQLQQVSLILQPLIVILEKYAANQAQANTKTAHSITTINLEKYRDDFSTLRGLLSYDDPEALDVLDELIQEFSSSSYSVQLERVQQSASEYDFEEALGLFESFLSDMNIALK